MQDARVGIQSSDQKSINNSSRSRFRDLRAFTFFPILFGWLVGSELIAVTASFAADLEILSVDTRYGIDFDTSVSNVNAGSFDGSGVQANPTVGQLDADSWSFEGFSGIDDLARGTSLGGVSSGGLYAFDHSGGVTSPDILLGVQPTGTDFTPGSITLGILNNTGQMVSTWDIDYDIGTFNNGDRSSSLNFSYAVGGGAFQDVPELNFSTPEVSDLEPAWMLTGRAATLMTEVGQGEQLFLRWTSDDLVGTGSRDEFGLDNIGVKAVAAVPEPSQVTGLVMASLIGLTCLWRKHRRNSCTQTAK